MRILAVSIFLVLGPVGLAAAGPLDVKQVGADAAWVAHIDVDALWASTVFQKASEKFLEKHPQLQKPLAMVRRDLKLDPAKDLFALTFYGQKIRRDAGVLLVHAKVDRNVLLERARQLPHYRLARQGKYEIHSWSPGEGPRRPQVGARAFYKSDLLVFAATADEVVAALEVLDGKRPNLADKSSPLAATTPPGAVFVARAVGLGAAELPYKSPLVRLADSFEAALGEYHAQMFLDARVVAKSPEIAQQIKAIVEGGQAMANLEHDDPDVSKIVDALKVTLTDKTVAIHWQAAADDVWNVAKKAAKHIAERKEAIEKQREKH